MIDDEVSTATIVQIERAFMSEWTNGDFFGVGPLLTENYVASGAFGEMDTRLDRQSLLGTGELSYRIVEAHDFQVKVYGDVAVLTARLAIRGHRKGRDISGNYLHTRIYFSRHGSWRAVAGQLKPVPSGDSV